MTSTTKRFWDRTLVILGLVAVVSIFSFWLLSREPNRTVTFVREVPTSVAPEKVGLALHWILSWPQWHHMTTDVKRLDGMGTPLPLSLQSAQIGAIVEFTLDPREQKQRRFFIQAEVTEYVPNQHISLKLIKESSGKLQAMFQDMSWKIEILPGTPHGAPGLGKQATEAGTLVRGTLTATTQNWRARLFSRIAERILMHQVFYPNVTKLAELKEPQRFDPTASPAAN